MKRRDFNRIALGAGLSPLLAKPTLAQWYEGQSPPTQEPPKKFDIVIKHSPRTYNQVNVPRKSAAGRRFTIYWTWSYPWEANRDVTELDNRFSTMTEVRRVAWPNYEKPEYSEKVFLQGIGGTLELFHLSTVRFQTIVGQVTGQPVVVYQRIDQAGQKLPIDERMLADTDTLMVFGLDHLITEQEAAPEEIEAIKQFLTRDGTCLMIGPHHDVGASQDVRRLQMEYAHHGDPLVPRQQRFGLYTRSLMKGLGVPVENRFGLRPAVVPGTNQIAPLTAMRDLDRHGWLANVPTLQFSPTLAALCADDGRYERNSCSCSTAGRFDQTASFHRGRQHRIQFVPLDAAVGLAGWPYPASGPDNLHHLVWRRREFSITSGTTSRQKDEP